MDKKITLADLFEKMENKYTMYNSIKKVEENEQGSEVTFHTEGDVIADILISKKSFPIIICADTKKLAEAKERFTENLPGILNHMNNEVLWSFELLQLEKAEKWSYVTMWASDGKYKTLVQTKEESAFLVVCNKEAFENARAEILNK